MSDVFGENRNNNRVVQPQSVFFSIDFAYRQESVPYIRQHLTRTKRHCPIINIRNCLSINVLFSTSKYLEINDTRLLNRMRGCLLKENLQDKIMDAPPSTSRAFHPLKKNSPVYPASHQSKSFPVVFVSKILL